MGQLLASSALGGTPATRRVRMFSGGRSGHPRPRPDLEPSDVTLLALRAPSIHPVIRPQAGRSEATEPKPRFVLPMRRPLRHVARRPDANRQGTRDLAVAAAVVPLESQDLSGLPHGQSLRWHSTPLGAPRSTVPTRAAQTLSRREPGTAL